MHDQLTARCPGNGKRGNVPVNSAGDTGKQRDVMTSRDLDYGISSVTSFGTPTQRHYYDRLHQHQQQLSDDRLQQISSLNPNTDARLTYQWNVPRRQLLWQKLLVSHRTTAVVNNTSVNCMISIGGFGLRVGHRQANIVKPSDWGWDIIKPAYKRLASENFCPVLYLEYQ